MKTTRDLGEFLQNPSEYERLDLRSQIVTDEDCQTIAESLKGNTSLKELWFDRADISDAGAKTIVEALKDNKGADVLKELSFLSTNVGDEVAKLVGEYLQSAICLSSLWFDGTQIGDKGAVAIGEALANNTSLTKLYLHTTQIRDEGAVAIGKALANNSSLNELYLHTTQIRDESAVAIGKGLITNNTLTWLDLRKTKIDDAKLKEIKDFIKKPISERLYHALSILDEIKLQYADDKEHLIKVLLRLAGLCVQNNKPEGVLTCLQEADKITEQYLQEVSQGTALLKEKLHNSSSPKIISDLQKIMESREKYFREMSTLKENLYSSEEYFRDTVTLKEGVYASSVSSLVGDLYETVASLEKKMADLQNQNASDHQDSASESSSASSKSESDAENEEEKDDITDTCSTKSSELTQDQSESEHTQDPNNKGVSISDTDDTDAAFSNIEWGGFENDRTTTDDTLSVNSLQEQDFNDYQIPVADSTGGNDENRGAVKEILDLMAEGNSRIQGRETKGMLLLGTTGAGKTTFANLLSGKALKCIRAEYGLELVSDSDDAFKISNAYDDSETKIPNKAKLSDAVLWDCAGFHDRGGAVQELANAFYIKRLFTTTDELKFVLVATDSSLMENRGSSFLTTLKYLIGTFKSLDKLKDSLSLVVTKSPKDRTDEHIKNVINALSKKSDITEEQISILSFLKSIHIFHKPRKNEVDKKLERDDLVANIGKSTEYIETDEELASMAVSEEAMKYAGSLLLEVENNYKHLLNILMASVRDPLIHLEKKSDLLEGYSYMVKPWLPQTVKYLDQSGVPEHESGQYFLGYELMHKLKENFIDDSIEPRLKIEKALRIFEEFSQDDSVKKQVQGYVILLRQQEEMIKFFSEVCKQNVDFSYLAQLVAVCTRNVGALLEEKVNAMKIAKNHDDIKYYETAIKYLDLYESDKCTKDKAECYLLIGGIYQSQKDTQRALDNYKSAMHLNKNSELLYSKLGELFKSLGKYEEAIKCYKVINHHVSVKNCYKAWITKNPEDTKKLLMEMADYCASAGLNAHKSYLKLNELVIGDAQQKQEIFNKIGLLPKVQQDAFEDYSKRAEGLDFYNFDTVNPEEFCQEIMGDVML